MGLEHEDSIAFRDGVEDAAKLLLQYLTVPITGRKHSRILRAATWAVYHLRMTREERQRFLDAVGLTWADLLPPDVMEPEPDDRPLQLGYHCQIEEPTLLPAQPAESVLPEPVLSHDLALAGMAS